MTILCSRAVNRFHATRQMAEHCESPTMSFMLDVGLRTVEDKIWHYLKSLAHYAVWLMGGAYMRHSRRRRVKDLTRVKARARAKPGRGNPAARGLLLH